MDGRIAKSHHAAAAAPQSAGAFSQLKLKLTNWMVNEGYVLLFFWGWIITQALLYLTTFLDFYYSEDAAVTNAILGFAYPSARGAAMVLRFNAATILFPVCRRLMTWMRNSRLNRFVPWDKNLSFHKAVGWSTFVFTWVHTISHWRNCYSLSRLDGGESWAFYALGTGPGWTGHVMLVALCLICATSLNKVRRSKFEVFWYTHHLYGLYFLLFSVHGSFCFIKTENPPYCVSTGIFWKFWIAGGLCYMLERIAREVRGRRRTYVSKVVLHPSKVVELQIKMENTTAQAGQYIFLCCPAVSVLQYHPFTLTSSPEEDFLSVHIKCEGNFTSRLYKILGCDVQAKAGDAGAGEIGKALPRVMIDGPFGTASQDVFHFEATVLVGAGIGVTPFASILKSIWYRMSHPAVRSLIRRVYFIWICREKEAFEWFQELLKAIEQQDSNGFIDIRVYLTKALKSDEIKNVQLNNDRGGRDAITGLRSPTYYGRPNWDQIFEKTRRRHPATDVGVFFCGPKPLSKQLYVACNKWSEPHESGTRFYYNKENF